MLPNIDSSTASISIKIKLGSQTTPKPVKENKCPNCTQLLLFNKTAVKAKKEVVEKALISQFENIVLGRQRTVFSNLMKDIKGRVHE